MNENQIFWNKKIIELRVHIERQQQTICELESFGAQDKADSVRASMEKNFKSLNSMVSDLSA